VIDVPDKAGLWL